MLFRKNLFVKKVMKNILLSLLQDSSQIGLLKELLDLQKDMVVMLLSLLEGEMSRCRCTLLFVKNRL